LAVSVSQSHGDGRTDVEFFSHIGMIALFSLNTF
jgi:hypothetical protein